MWKGNTFSIENTRVFKARFHRYLNSPVTEESKEYARIIDGILQRLSVNNKNASEKEFFDAWTLLFEAAKHDEDRKNSLIIANTVNGIWRIKSENRSLDFAQEDLAKLRNYQQSVVADRADALAALKEKQANSKQGCTDGSDDSGIVEFLLKPLFVKRNWRKLWLKLPAWKPVHSAMGCRLNFRFSHRF